jgi:hypothetical protein
MIHSCERTVIDNPGLLIPGNLGLQCQLLSLLGFLVHQYGIALRPRGETSFCGDSGGTVLQPRLPKLPWIRQVWNWLTLMIRPCFRRPSFTLRLWGPGSGSIGQVAILTRTGRPHEVLCTSYPHLTAS